MTESDNSPANSKIVRLNREQQDAERLLKIVQRLDGSFIPPLSTMVALDNYCHKLTVYAENLLLNFNGQDIGFVCFYANDTAQKTAFITAVAVDPQYAQQGLGMRLLEAAFSQSRALGMNQIRLEVNKHNQAALALYRKAGFTITDTSASSDNVNSLFLERPL
jgi:ribosomal protein S18 acetylase RimI-like enzyme